MPLTHRNIKNSINITNHQVEEPRGLDPRRKRIRCVLSRLCESAVLLHDIPVLVPIDHITTVATDGNVVDKDAAPVLAVKGADTREGLNEG